MGHFTGSLFRWKKNDNLWSYRVYGPAGLYSKGDGYETKAAAKKALEHTARGVVLL